MSDMFRVDKFLVEIQSNKNIKDFKKSDLYRALLLIDESSIIGNSADIKYKNAILYWAAPLYGTFYENGEDFLACKEKIENQNKRGIIYLVKINENLFKFGRTINMRKRMNGYPRGSELLRYEEVDDMVEAEKILLNCANESNGKLWQGNEFYYYTDQDEPFKVYENALSKISL